ncbi:hypothetical protein Rt10032_c03g1273 [Rhodotorula toruloides]|uniref:Glutamine synthetase n=1 Tax=Rhodotorula toruloides TaxID=5286 RepID=A0A511KBE8_RHOTO|nr:hypothetical protein Rt10032_c03g1273 [Rhodotorula toruloides]
MGILLPGSPVLLSLLTPSADPSNSTASAAAALDALAYVPKQPSQANPLPALIGVVVESILEVAILWYMPTSNFSVPHGRPLTLGWYLAKKGIVDAKAKKTLNKINTSLFTPCLLFNKVAFSLTPDKLAELYIIPIGFCLVSAFSAGVAYLLGRVAGLRKGQRDFAIACATFQNSNSLPIALLQSLIGEKLPLAWGPHDTRDGMLGRGLTYLVLYSSLGIIVRWSIGVRLLSSAETQSPTCDTATEGDAERGEAEGPGVREDETDEREGDGLLATAERDGNARDVRKSTLKNGGGARRTRESTASSSTLTPEPSSSSNSNGNGKLVPLPPDAIDPADDRGAFSTPQRRRKRTRIFQSFPNTPIPSVYSSSSLRSSADSASLDDEDEDGDGEGDGSLASSGWDDEDAEWGARRGFGRRWLGTGSVSGSPVLTRVKKGTARAWRKVKRVWSKVADFMTVPLWAAVLSLVVACIPPLQSVLNKAEPVKSAIRSAGSCSVPITLVTLGAYFYRPSGASAADTSPLRREEQELPRSFRHKLLHLVKKPFAPRKDDGDGEGDDKSKGETSTVIVAVVSRMIVVPLVLIPLFAWYAKVTVNVADDPVFVVVACLLIGSPTAITLAQITSSAAGPTFEKLISRTLLTLDGPVSSVDDLKEWNFDGSSTGQAEGANSDVFLRPAAYFRDPFRRGDNIIVICETYNNDGTPNKYNHRYSCMKTMEAASKSDPWFGLEQEYTIFGSDGRPYGWPVGGFPGPQGPYYCGVGAGKVFARDMIEAHYRACLYAGVNISGINAEVMPSQWEFQVGPCAGKDMGDHLWMARYLLVRIAEEWGVTVSFHPKPLAGDWNGAGCHTNYSTAETRADGGMKVIEEMIKKLEKRHMQHIEVYGSDNDLRLTGRHETGHIGSFSWGVANRGSSIRVPKSVALAGKGYFEDRRPASNIDPYSVCDIMVQTTLLSA